MIKPTNVSSFRIKLVYSRTLYSQSAASVTMGSLAAYLRLSGLEVDICLVDTKAPHSTRTFFENSSNDTVIIAKPNFKDFLEILPFLERLKHAGLTKRIFLCGPFAKLNAEKIMSKLAWLDGVFMDQLETSALQLLLTMSPDFTSWNFLSPGAISRNTQTGVVGGHRPLINPIPLSNLPFPARDIETKEDVGFVNLEASRGCMFECSFCHIPLMSEMSTKTVPLNVRDPVFVVDEIERINREMGKTLFIFNDSCFWSTKKDDVRILGFCKEITRRRLDVRFYVYLKGEPFIGIEVLNALVKVGLVRVFLGVENAVKSSLATYRKKIEPDLYETVKSRLDPLGVNIHIGYITIEPHSSLDDVLSNIDYLFRIGKLFRLGVILEPVRVVPRSSLHQQLIKEGLMSSDLDYGEITYGYRFVHKEVGHLLNEWKKMFHGCLKDISYRFEYYSTTGELLRVLAERHDPKFVSLLRSCYTHFNTKKLEGSRMLLGYFKRSIESARFGKVNLAGNIEYNQQFVDGFTQTTEELAIMYRGITSTIKQNGGDRVVREVYS